MKKDSSPPRLASPDREQVRLLPTDLDALLPLQHPARALWDFLDELDLSDFYARIRARGSEPGRPATDPKLLLALWIFATSEGVGSARRLATLCERDLAYRWLCGGVPVNHRVLSEFRTERSEELDALFTRVLGVLLKEGILKLTRVSHDGVRVRASAGAASFRRRTTLEHCLKMARRRIRETRREAEGRNEKVERKREAARERAAKEKEAAIRRALKEMPKVEAVKARSEKKRAGKEARMKASGEADSKKSERASKRRAPRVSTTDPEARVMKMADGGFRPAYNGQLAVDTESRFIVGVGVTNKGNDYGEVPPMLEDIQRRTGKLPEEYLVDGGFTHHGDLTHAAGLGITVYAGMPKPREGQEHIDPHRPRKGDPPAVAAWRARMGTPEAKEIYKLRASTVETVNADLRCRKGLQQFLVRGLEKVRTSFLLTALSYNVMRALPLVSR